MKGFSLGLNVERNIKIRRVKRLSGASSPLGRGHRRPCCTQSEGVLVRVGTHTLLTPKRRFGATQQGRGARHRPQDLSPVVATSCCGRVSCPAGALRSTVSPQVKVWWGVCVCPCVHTCVRGRKFTESGQRIHYRRLVHALKGKQREEKNTLEEQKGSFVQVYISPLVSMCHDTVFNYPNPCCPSHRTAALTPEPRSASPSARAALSSQARGTLIPR